MFNIGPAELIVIFLVALLIVGPKRLPEMGRTIGKAMREFRKATDDFKQHLDFESDDDDGAFREEHDNGKDPVQSPSPPPTPPPAQDDPERHT